MEFLSKFLRSKLKSIVKGMALNKEEYLKNPKCCFIRKRKLSFSDVVMFVLTIGSNSINKEILSNPSTCDKLISASGLSQLRDKLAPLAFESIFYKFNEFVPQSKSLKGYRIVAVDGSDINIPYNPKNLRTFIKQKDAKGYNQIHLNACFDILNGIYVNARIQDKSVQNEHKDFLDMVTNFPLRDKTLFILDRGYEAYNNFANVEKLGHKYLIRAKDITSNGILSSLKNLLPKEEEFSSWITINLTRLQTNEVKKNKDKFKFIPNNLNFSFLPLGSKQAYEVKFRVVRVSIGDGNYESLITNLGEDEFTVSEIKELYNMRWGIETSFRDLKYSLGLISFHSKKNDFIIQEVFSKLVMYNFASAVSNSVTIIQNKKYQYKINFSTAVYVVVDFIKNNKAIAVEQMIKKFLTPIRKDRKYRRQIRPQSAVPFNYKAY